MKKAYRLLVLSVLLIAMGFAPAVAAVSASGLDKQNFKKYWTVESESPDYKLAFMGDTLEIVAPKGLTLWRNDKMSGDVTIEYDACVMQENDGDRLSDLNCFWMASDPSAQSVLKNAKKRGGVFVNSYGLQLYYLGYGGNSNSTTRFRRYDGNAAGIADANARPKILTEYTDADHLLQPNHWYHIKITKKGNRTEYYIDGKRLVDFRDAEPLDEGWFGFRTTQSRTRIANFNYSCVDPMQQPVPLQWIGAHEKQATPTTFGVPFCQGELADASMVELKSADGTAVPIDTWRLAQWPDGSVKWLAVAGVIPADAQGLTLNKVDKKAKKAAPQPDAVTVTETASGFVVNTGCTQTYISCSGNALIDSIINDGVNVAKNGRLVVSTQSEPVVDGTKSVTFHRYVGKVDKVEVERDGNCRALVKVSGSHADEAGESWLPFTVRLYFYGGSPEIKMAHTIVYDGDMDLHYINSLGVRFDVPMREDTYNRHVAFATADGGVWSEPVQPVVGRRVLKHSSDAQAAPGTPSWQARQMMGERIPARETFDETNQGYLRNWAAWEGYRLSQLSADAFTIRKRAHDTNPWIGTFSGTRAPGYAFVGDITGGLAVKMEDFFQSYPSTIQIDNATTPNATLTMWLWSPEAEPMDLRHYDTVAHDLIAAYEDVQEGMSTPYGIARTSEFTLIPHQGYRGKEAFAVESKALTSSRVLLPTPEYLHSRRAFGVWSLPDSSNPRRAEVEAKLKQYTDFYRDAQEQHKWYGFWHYGDVMHAYDPVRHEFLYDVGGYAWDNTELASPMWLWYNFLRTGDPEHWRMARAMSRHNGDVDVYHIGPNAGLGTRHNVSHWGCGAKEGRISQAAWNRFLYYLTADERSGDLMSEVTDADQMLYTLDPMRLAEPRDMYPCTAPARLRFGPDWLSYAANWMTEWERTGNTKYRDKIEAGMRSIAALPHRLFQGPLALGYDPATGIITTECDTAMMTTNHLMTIMGGFEIMNEMIPMMNIPEWNDAWLDHCARDKEMAIKIRHHRFRISRLLGYAAYYNRDSDVAAEAWQDLMTRLESVVAPKTTVKTVEAPHVPAPRTELLPVSTNDAALWSLDAIYMQEVVPIPD